MHPEPGEVTLLLEELRAGKSDAASRLIKLVYPELRKIAANHLRREGAGHSLRPTALANEAYLYLVGNADVDWRNRGHFFAVAAQAIRRILVDYARKRKAAKRDGARIRVEFTDVLAVSEDRIEEVIAVDEALTRLAEWDPRQCQIVEMKFFGGLTEKEIAEVLGVSTRTVLRDWKVARAWLHGELTGSSR